MNYLLNVKQTNKADRNIPIISEIKMGLDPRNDLILISPNIEAKHFTFRLKEGTLLLNHHSKKVNSFLNGMPIHENQNYILAEDDIIKIDDIEIKIIRSKN